MLSRLKKLAIHLLLLILLFCCGCFTMRVDDFCERCYEDTYILERRCEWSQDGESFTVHCRKRIDFCRDPFKINTGSEEIAMSHTYSLTTPEPNAKFYRLKFVPDINGRRIGVSGAFVDIKDGWTHSYGKEVDYDRLALPIILPGPLDSSQVTIHVHPDDLQLFQKPFLVHSILAIPYKMEGNLCHFYVPNENLVSERNGWHRPNAPQKTLKLLLKPPAAILDIITSPVQFCIAILDILTGANISPYP